MLKSCAAIGCTKRQGSRVSFFLYFLLVKSDKNYDGASVNSRKKNLNLFSPPFFYQNSRKNIFKYIFSNVFPKTAEKKYLNLFSPTFFQKQEKKYI